MGPSSREHEEEKKSQFGVAEPSSTTKANFFVSLQTEPQWPRYFAQPNHNIKCNSMEDPFVVLEIYCETFISSTDPLSVPAASEMLCNSTKGQLQAYLASPLLNQLFRCPTSGRTISFAESGDPDGIPVAVLIGLGCHRLFAALYHDLAAKWKLRFIVIDRPGYGRSDNVPIEERVAGYPAMLEELFTHLNLTSLSLICQSCGTIPGLAYSLAYPARLAGRDVHLVSPWIPTSISKAFSWARFIPTLMIAQSHFIPMRIDLPHSIQFLFNTQPTPGHVAFAQLALVSAIFKSANQECMKGQSQDLLMCIERGSPWPFQFWDVKEKGLRVKIYQGSKDSMVSCNMVRRLVQTMREKDCNVVLKVYEGIGHSNLISIEAVLEEIFADIIDKHSSKLVDP